jgi:hypothetical protein
VTQFQILCFVDATYLLGEHFDTDRRHGWSRELLTSPLAAEEKANCLLDSACEKATGAGPTSEKS